MDRFFNTAGPCLPQRHYMIPPEQRLGQVRELIDRAAFFVIHAPRQTGKTTLIRSLSRKLTAEGKYAALTVSLESFTEPDVDKMLPRIVDKIQRDSLMQLPKGLEAPGKNGFVNNPHTALNGYLSAWAEGLDLPLVVLLDEADAIPGEVLISVLRQLRDGYTSRPAPFPQSVALVGMRDVRDYKIQIREDLESLGTASPFNIKDRSLTLRNFTREEVFGLLAQHTQATGQVFTEEAQTEIFRQTQGQPWLVNALAGQTTTDIDAVVSDRDQPVTKADVQKAREILIERRDTHLDSLVDKLREGRVKRVIEPILIGSSVQPDVYNDDFKYVEDLGLVNRHNGTTEIANPIYAEIIPRVLTYVTQGNVPDKPEWYVAADGTLNLRKLIDGFIEFWRENGEVLLKGMPYQEAAPHLVFMAYLQRIVNSGGRLEREFALGTKRADLFVDYGGRKDVIELKLAGGYKTLENGLSQVAGYAKRLGRDVGYLVLFDVEGAAERKKEEWWERGEVEERAQDGVRVVILRV